jgi:nucleotide-binding universal stress UspA family protein
MFEKILVATDGSAPSEYAAKAGVELAKSSGGRIIAMYVVDKGKIFETIEEGGYELAKDVTDGARLGLQKEGKIATKRIEDLGMASGVTVESKVVVGNPAEVILKAADDGIADTIIVGSIGKTGLAKFLLGSVAEKVVRNSKVPVVVVPVAPSR